jgi:hypothetical protein
MDHGDMDMGHGGGQCVTNVRLKYTHVFLLSETEASGAKN